MDCLICMVLHSAQHSCSLHLPKTCEWGDVHQLPDFHWMQDNSVGAQPTVKELGNCSRESRVTWKGIFKSVHRAYNPKSGFALGWGSSQLPLQQGLGALRCLCLDWGTLGNCSSSLTSTRRWSPRLHSTISWCQNNETCYFCTAKCFFLFSSSFTGFL